MIPSGFSEIEHPINPLCQRWLRKIDDSLKVKQERFGQYADEAMKFYDGAHDFMWREEYASGVGGYLDKDAKSSNLPHFKMTVNRPFEAVALFGPALFFKYPAAKITPIEHPEIPPEALGIMPNDQGGMMQYQQVQFQKELEDSNRETHAGIFQHYANWAQIEGGKKVHARRAITEAIVKGLGLTLTEIVSPQGSSVRYPQSRYISCDDYTKDPDADYAEDVQWIAVRCIHPVNLVEKEYNLPPGSLKGHLESIGSQGTTYGYKPHTSRAKREKKSFDLIEYWKIWSKNGFGDRLAEGDRLAPQSRINFEAFGDYCHIVVAKDIPFPLNMPSWSLAQPFEQVFQMAQWPIPFFTDESSGAGNGWPVSELFFYDKPRGVWPISLIKPCIGELRFVNWCMSFLADKVAASSNTYLGIHKAAAREIQDQISSGTAPYTVLEISDLLGKSIKDVVSFIDPPPFQKDVWTMVSEVLDMIDKRTGLTELIYGVTGKQLRSAQEASIKDEQISIRPDEMSNKTDDWLSQTVLKELEAAIWSLDREDVEPILGDLAASIWEQRIQTQEFEKVVRDFEFRIEAGSARKPNKQQRIRSLNELGQSILPTIQALALGGVVNPWNAFIQDIGEAMDVKDVERYLIQFPPQQEGEGEEQEKLDNEDEAHEQQLQHDQEAHDQDMGQQAEKNSLMLQMERAKLDFGKKKLALDISKARSMASAAKKNGAKTNGSA